MKKRLILSVIIILSILVLIIGWSFYVEIYVTYNGLEFLIPLICKREITTLSNGDVFNYEKVEKMYLSKKQAKRVLNDIENNPNWIKGNIDHEVEKALESHTRENIFYKIPYINNKYWIFTTLGHGVNDKHSIKEIIDNKIYYSITFGIFDIDNNILYFYEYDR